MSEQANGSSPWGIGAVVVVLVALGVWVAADDSGSGADDVNRYDAERVCKEEFIADRLKAPGTADYDLAVSGGPDTYTVTGTVDAENSFGAKLRSDVRCVVTLEGERWRLVSVTGLD